MINKFFAFLMLGVLMVGSFGTAAFADTRKKKSVKKQTNAFAALLPASDAVAVFDGKKFFNTALPQVLSDNQPLLNKIIDHLNEVKSKIGIDARQFEQIAVGVGIKKISAREFDFAPVALMRGGQINAGALIALAKTAANGKYREEKIGDKSVFVFDLRDAAKNVPANGGQNNKLETAFSKMPKELAVTAFDGNTLAVGTTERIRETLTSKLRIAPDVAGLLDRNPNAVMSFGGKVPGGMRDLLPLDNDELGKNIDAIKYLSGSADVAENNAVMQFVAKTVKADDAQNLLDQLQGLQLIGKAFLGSSKSAKTQVYGRMIDNANFTRNANEVVLDLQVPQTDINVLIGEKK